VKFVKRANKGITINGNNNKVEIVNTVETKTIAAVVIVSIALASAAVLVISLCCPKQLKDFVRFLKSLVVGS
jgi:hypothetical protein